MPEANAQYIWVENNQGQLVKTPNPDYVPPITRPVVVPPPPPTPLTAEETWKPYTPQTPRGTISGTEGRTAANEENIEQRKVTQMTNQKWAGSTATNVKPGTAPQATKSPYVVARLKQLTADRARATDYQDKIRIQNEINSLNLM